MRLNTPGSHGRRARLNEGQETSRAEISRRARNSQKVIEDSDWLCCAVVEQDGVNLQLMHNEDYGSPQQLSKPTSPLMKVGPVIICALGSVLFVAKRAVAASTAGIWSAP